MTAPSAGTSGPSDEPFRIELTIDAPPDAVWRALRDKEQILQWHGWELDSLEAEVDQIFFTDVVEAPDERRFVASGGDTFQVVDLGDTSIIRMTRGPRDPANFWDKWYDEINEGWTTFLHQLRFALERHPGDRRRTVHVEGAGTGVDPIDALGLRGPVPVRAGNSYATELVGQRVSGEVWFTSVNQAGYTVSQWGDGLIVVGTSAPTTERPSGGVMAVLTTYGLPDDELADLTERWTNWWSAHYPAPPAPDADQSTSGDSEGPQQPVQ
jgi:uncharacterized protein YndB with AHSA1/START domain